MWFALVLLLACAKNTDADGDGSPASVDCDDTDPVVHPGASETCDAKDDDCNALVDDNATDATPWFDDTDGDGYGDPGRPTRACAAPAGSVADFSDCDDASAAVHPGATELCNGLDDDCDRLVDNAAADASIGYADTDGDGYGDPSTGVSACDPPGVSDGTDCDDTDADVNPGAAEVCDSGGVDENCNGLDDDSDPTLASGTEAWYGDGDGDGFGDPRVSSLACEPPSGFVSSDTDCDDTRASVNPDEPEVCGDGLDDNCDGSPNSFGLSGVFSAADAAGTLMGTGWRVAAVGDVDGDGIPDFTTSFAHDASVALFTTLPSGAVDVADGATGLLTAESAGDESGISVAGVGDVDGDGYGDILVGADYAGDSYQGAAYLMSGPITGTVSLSTATAKITGVGTYEFAGNAVAGPGDLNGDDVPDLVVGAWASGRGGSHAGCAYVLYGPVTGPVSGDDADAILVGDVASGAAGQGVAGAGDANGDGIDDLLVGAPYGSSGSRVDLITTAPSGTVSLADADATFDGIGAFDLLGYGLAGVGDTNGDAYDDLFLGAPFDDTTGFNAGAGYLFLGPIASEAYTMADADGAVMGIAAGDEVGLALSPAGDVDGDGQQDLLVGGPYHDCAGAAEGAAWVVLGGLAGVISASDADVEICGTDAGSRAGSAVAGPGDLDADGFAELLIGAPSAAPSSAETGAVYIVRGDKPSDL